MIQTKKKPVVAAAAAVAPSPQTPYTAARSGKDTTVNRAEADGSAQALDRRVTEGFNLVHGRLDVIQEDVRENRRDIKELRKELWDGLREAAADRARLASKADLDQLGESAAADRRRVEKEAAADRARLASKADLDQLGESAAADRRRVEKEAAADRARLASRADLDQLGESAAADRRRVEKEAAADRARLASRADLDQLRESAAADRRRVEKEAAADRARLASKADLDQLGKSAAADRRRIEGKFDTALATFRAEVNERFATQESSQRELIAMVSKVLERTEAATWTRRRLWVAVAAGTSLLVIGAVLRPLLERAAQVLFGG